jgi:hypothetical protein
MKKLWFMLIILMALPISYAHSSEVTSLSEKASHLKIGMSRQEVIKLLGPPTWAVIPGDRGQFTLSDPSLSLELHWKNRPCAPVVVQFNRNNRVDGWDEGRAICGEDAKLFELTKDYSSKRPDRSKFCK